MDEKYKAAMVMHDPGCFEKGKTYISKSLFKD